ncbi:MAG: tRNA (N(6)-L-threonylcarbamoyladenosine(37)-C(2))-methylthiotransferase MtaB [Kiloniellales bacterium]|nr:tRNA (N(6)-L-threonylcarbamoyladenosine(37)-C(2))-methylthiotransferase MtaB [Kiloniellales bacterium]
MTFGCRLNAYESEVMRGHATASGMEDCIIVNTCAVTAEAERQARQAIRRARRTRPSARIIVTGCAAQVDPERFARMPDVDLVLGNAEKLMPQSYLPDYEGPKVRVNDIMSVKETASHLIEGMNERTRAFLQVQQGCNHRCTFCIIPFGRGNSRSVPMGELVRQVRHLVAAGVPEVVLSGVDITSYGEDLPGKPTLGQTVRRLLAQVPGLQRLRLSSIDAVELDEDIFRLLETEPRLMPHLHLSLQAGHDLTLKRMKRRHLRNDAIRLCERARSARPDVVFGADLIAGFPTENEEMFKGTLDLIFACGLTYLHVFPYSPRPGTPAAKMPQVPQAIRKERAAKLREAGAAQVQRFLISRLGVKERVLIEKPGFGHSEHFAPIRLEAGKAGDIVEAVPHDIENGQLIAGDISTQKSRSAA